MDHDGRVNPYAPPGQDAPAPGLPVLTAGTLASRNARLSAAVADSLIMLAVLTPFQYAAGVYDNFPHIAEQSFMQKLVWSAVGFAVWVGMHGYFIHNGAQTLGKRWLGLQVVNDADSKPASFGKIVLLRFLPIQIAVMVPQVGSVLALVDALFIYRKDHRCLHDLIAGTRVIVKPTS